MLSQQDSERLAQIQQELKNLQKVFVQFQNKADLLAHEVSQITQRANLTTTTNLESKTEIYASTEQVEQPITPPKLPQEESIISQNTFADYFHTTVEKEEEAIAPQTPFNWEDYIGGNILGKVGMLLLLISIGFFINYAIENELIGPVGRVVLAYSAGSILIGLAYWLKPKYLNYSALLMGGGLATAYFTTYFTYLLFGYFSQGLSFGLMFLITLYAVIEALRYNKQVIGLFGLVAAYAIPLFLSNQSGNITIFFAYILLINGGILFLAFRKKWYLLYYTAFAFTWLIFLGWFNAKYTPADFNTALSFSFLFFFTFFLLLLINQLLAEKPESFLWIIANGLIFYGIGFVLHSQAGKFDILAQDTKSLPVVGFTLLNSVFYAVSAIYVFLRTRQTSNLWGVLVLQSLFFFTLGVPIYLSTQATITVWALEVLAIFALNLKLQQLLFHQTAIVLALILQIVFFTAINSHYSNFSEVNSQALFLNSFFFTYFLIVLILFITARIPKPEQFTQIDNFWKGEWIFWLAIFFSYYIVVAEINFYYENQTKLIYNSISLNDNEKINASKYQYTDVLNNFSKIWRYLAIVVLTFLYAVVLQAKTPIKTPLRLLNFILVGLLALFIVISSSLYDLRQYYLNFLINSANFEFPPTLMYWAVRILVYAALAGLIGWQWRLHVQAKSLYNTPEGRTLFLSTLIWVLWILCDELLSIVLFRHTSSTEALLDAQKQVVKIGFTILWVVYSSLCIAWGIFKKRKFFRFAGFGIFAIAFIKIFIFDISYASTLSKIIVFFSVALLFLIVSFAYQRYKDIILAPDE